MDGHKKQCEIWYCCVLKENYLLDDEDMSLMWSFERCVKISVCLGFYLKLC